MFPDSELEPETSSRDTGIGTGRINPAEMNAESRRDYNNTLRNIHKRGMDCQRMLKARFPSLLGMRVQLKDDAASRENAKNWIIACMMIHNLVLGDDSCYNPEWEEQLDEMEKAILQQQEHQARLMWKLENHPPKKVRMERLAAQQEEGPSDILGDALEGGGEDARLQDDHDHGDDMEGVEYIGETSGSKRRLSVSPPPDEEAEEEDHRIGQQDCMEIEVIQIDSDSDEDDGAPGPSTKKVAPPPARATPRPRSQRDGTPSSSGHSLRRREERFTSSRRTVSNGRHSLSMLLN